jgi:hypothetical protein
VDRESSSLSPSCAHSASPPVLSGRFCRLQLTSPFSIPSLRLLWFRQSVPDDFSTFGYLICRLLHSAAWEAPGRSSPQFPPDHAPSTTAFAYSMASTFAGGTSSQTSSMLGFGPAATAPFFGSSGEQQSQRLQQYYQSPQRQQPAPAMPHTERPSAPGRRSGKVKFFDTQKVSAVTRSGCLASVSPSAWQPFSNPRTGAVVGPMNRSIGFLTEWQPGLSPLRTSSP